MNSSKFFILSVLLTLSLCQQFSSGIINQVPHDNKRKPFNLGNNIKIVKQNPQPSLNVGRRQIITTTTTPIYTTTTQQPTILVSSSNNQCKVGGRFNHLCMSVYQDENSINSNNRYKKRYACYKKAKCALVNGECRWLQTKKYRKCLNKIKRQNNRGNNYRNDMMMF